MNTSKSKVEPLFAWPFSNTFEELLESNVADIALAAAYDSTISTLKKIKGKKSPHILSGGVHLLAFSTLCGDPGCNSRHGSSILHADFMIAASEKVFAGWSEISPADLQKRLETGLGMLTVKGAGTQEAQERLGNTIGILRPIILMQERQQSHSQGEMPRIIVAEIANMFGGEGNAPTRPTH